MSILFCVGILFFPKKHASDALFSTSENHMSRSAIDVPVSVDESAFYGAVNMYHRKTVQSDYNIGGGIVPHHSLAGPVIAEFFSRLASGRSDIKTFIVLGPNHSNIGVSSVISCRANWQVSAGTVFTNLEILDELERERFVSIDNNHCAPDQAIQTLIPFIKNYFPDAKIVPLLFSSKNNNEQVASLADKIKQVPDQGVFVIASLDFSHYLSLAAAEDKDLVTMQTMSQRDYEKISRFNSDYVDSPFALIAFLRTMDLEGSKNMEVIRHSNSMDFLGQDPNNVTSYFSVFMKR